MSHDAGSYVHPAGQSRATLQRQFNRLLDEVSRLAESELDSPSFTAEVLRRLLAGTGGVAGAVWAAAANGTFYVECQRNLEEIGLDKAGPEQDAHADFIRQAALRGRPLAVPPRCGIDDAGSNSTDWPTLVAPVVVAGKTVALLETWQDPASGPETQSACLQFLAGMAHYASVWQRNRRLRELQAQQDLWLQLEAFSRRVHSSLDLTETALHIVNEGLPLAGGDRLNLAREDSVIAVSGVETVDRRSSQMRLLGRLCDRVEAWGEKLVYHGAPDDSLPPGVLDALDSYLTVCGCKLLVVVPVGTDDEQFSLVLESFDGQAVPEQAVERLEVLGRHAGSALANAAQFERMPLRGLGRVLARRNNSRVALRAAAVAGVVAAVLAVLVCVPYPLKMDATGQLLPRERRTLYSPVEGRVIRFEQGVLPGSQVAERQPLVLMYDTQLEIKLAQLTHEIAAAQDEIAALVVQQHAARTDAERAAFNAERKQKESLRNRKQTELKALREQTHADASRPGYFWLPAPMNGTILSWGFRERYHNRPVKPSEPLLQIGDKARGWEVELKIPHRHAGPILEALGAGRSAEELDVDLLLTSAPTQIFRGKLARAQIAAEASLDSECENPKPVVWALVRVSGDDIPEPLRIPTDLLVSGTEVHAKVRCGPHRLGFSLFYGVWEFLYEKVLFF